eukprot:1318074-Amorphochlora_amoeboformis.AAC.2
MEYPTLVSVNAATSISSRQNSISSNDLRTKEPARLQIMIVRRGNPNEQLQMPSMTRFYGETKALEASEFESKNGVTRKQRSRVQALK